MFARQFDLPGSVPSGGFEVRTGEQLKIVPEVPEDETGRTLAALPDWVPENERFRVPAFVLVEDRKLGTTFGRKPALPFSGDATDFIEFAKLAPGQPDGVLAFANRYGYCTGASGFKTAAGRVTGESLSQWWRAAAQLGEAVEVWRLLRAHDTAALGSLFHWAELAHGSADRQLSGDGWVYEPPAWAGGPRQASWVSGPTEGDDIETVAGLWLRGRVNGQIGTLVAPRLVLDDSGVSAIGLQPQNLKAALWLQFGFAVAGEQEYRDCVVCGKPFSFDKHNAVKARRVYCSDGCRVKASRQRAGEVATKVRGGTKPTKRKGK